MSLLFCSAIGFSFSFLNCLGRLALEADVSGTELASVFGLVNALGRLMVCLPLDYTRQQRWGGIYDARVKGYRSRRYVYRVRRLYIYCMYPKR